MTDTEDPITPAELLEKAKAVPRGREFYSLNDYAPALNELYVKGLTWTDIHAWALQNGIDRSEQSIVMAVRAWRIRRAFLVLLMVRSD